LQLLINKKNISNLFASRNQNLNDQSIGNEKDISDTTTSNNINTPDQLVQQQSEEDEKRIFQLCVQQLLWITAPEATCRFMAANNGEVLKQMQQNYHIDISSIYFKNQLYSSLPAFVDHVTNDPTWKIDEFGTSLIAMTYSPLVQNAANLLRDQKKKIDNHYLLLYHILLFMDLIKNEICVI